jgi:hypothetical protein
MKITSLVRSGIKVTVWFFLPVGLMAPLLAQKKLNAVAVTVGDLGNPFFVQIANRAITTLRIRTTRWTVLFPLASI